MKNFAYFAVRFVLEIQTISQARKEFLRKLTSPATYFVRKSLKPLERFKIRNKFLTAVMKNLLNLLNRF